MISWSSTASVSYTHLDVYKRQDEFSIIDGVSVKLDKRIPVAAGMAVSYTHLYVYKRQAYQNGDLDFIESIPTAEIEAAKKTSEFYTVDNLGTYYVGFNINSKPVSYTHLKTNDAKMISSSL